jgi:zinc protease
MRSFASRLAALALSVLVETSAVHAAWCAPPPATATMALGDTLRLDARVRTGVLPNGLRYFIRANHKPEARVVLRLAVNVGSTAEADDQRGLAHLNEHMNFNGSAHFKPDELVAYLQSIGLRFGADANAYTTFDETVYSLEVPTDRDSLLDRGVTALSDFAGRATLTDREIDKERGVVLEEWRLGLGAGDRIRRKQLPIVFHGSRYADRLPIGLPDVIEKAPYDRLRAFYHDWYTPDHMAVVAVGDIDPGKMETLIRERFGDLRRPPQARPVPVFDIPPHKETLVAIATDPEATGSSVTLGFKSPHEVTATVGDYRRDLVRDLYFSMLNERFDEIAHRAAPPFLDAGTGGGMLGRTDDMWELDAAAKDGGIVNGLAALLEEVARVRAHGFLAQRARARQREHAREMGAHLCRTRQVGERGLRTGVRELFPQGGAGARNRDRIRDREERARRHLARGDQCGARSADACRQPRRTRHRPLEEPGSRRGGAALSNRPRGGGKPGRVGGFDRRQGAHGEAAGAGEGEIAP